MNIAVTCACGARYSVDQKFEGRSTKCGKCGQMVLVKAPPVAKPLVNKCPACAAEMAPNAVLCVACGHDLRTGKKLDVEAAPRGPALDRADNSGKSERQGNRAAPS